MPRCVPALPDCGLQVASRCRGGSYRASFEGWRGGVARDPTPWYKSGVGETIDKRQFGGGLRGSRLRGVPLGIARASARRPPPTRQTCPRGRALTEQRRGVWGLGLLVRV